MAEPVIISYGRGLLKEFPGLPEGVVDVIPVDLVVAAILAVAARGPAADGPDVFQVATGNRNPLRYRRLVDLVQDWFTDHPLYDTDGQPIVVPEWSFPGRGRCNASSAGRSRASRRPRRWSRTCRCGAARPSCRPGSRSAAPRPSGPWATSSCTAPTPRPEAVFRVDRLLELWTSLDDDDRATFGFDPAAIDWDAYVHDVHLPSIVVHARVRTTPAPKGGPCPARTGAGRPVLAPDRHLAAFDLENTLIASNVVESYAWLATRPPARRRAGPVHGADAARGARPAGPRPPRPGRLPAPLLPPLRGRPRGPAAGRRVGAVQRPAPDEVVPRRHPPGARAPSARSPHRCSSPAPSTSSSSRCARCSTTSCAPASASATVASPASWCRRPAHRARPAPW